jgi:hypothetical protein
MPAAIPLVNPQDPVVQDKASIGIKDKDLNINPDQLANLSRSDSSYCDSELESFCISESNIHNEIIDNCETFLEQSKQERKATGRKTRQASRVIKQKAKKNSIKTFRSQTEGIDGGELRRRKAECLATR